MTMPVLKTVDGFGFAVSNPSITPPSRHCTSTSQSPISIARRRYDGSPVSRLYSNRVPMM
jgi:hypothetical protein